jgi:hypothetical protein
LHIHRGDLAVAYSLFLLPPDSVPANPPYKVWFSTWSEDKTQIEWSSTRPAADSMAKWAIGVRVVGAAEDVPAGSTLLVAGIKDDPPPPFVPVSKINADGFEKAFTDVYGSPKGFDHP